MSKLKETKKPSRTSDEDRSDEQSDERSSLDRLADFAKRILAVSKSELPSEAKANRA